MRKLLILYTLIASLICSSAAQAAADNGTIDSLNKYGWGDKLGWVNFGTAEGAVRVTDTKLTGYAWSENAGWINLNPTTSTFVTNNSNGTLSGFAWGEQIGWIDFTGVVIDAQGIFSGFASTTNYGKISFNCSATASCGSADFKITTDWRPQNVRTTPVVPAPVATGGGGGFYSSAPSTPTINDPFWDTGLQKIVITGTGSRYTMIDVVINQNEIRNSVATIENNGIFRIELALSPGEYRIAVRARNYAGVVSDISATKIGLVPTPLSVAVSREMLRIKNQKAALFPAQKRFLKNLVIGSRGSDVLYLQKFLNANGFLVATKGAGSPGKETQVFGSATKQALRKFQDTSLMSSAYKTGQLDPNTRQFINELK